jgi:hypothetical protein
MFWMHNILLQIHGALSHIRGTSIVNSFQICGFSLNQTSDGKDTTELSIAKDD